MNADKFVTNTSGGIAASKFELWLRKVMYTDGWVRDFGHIICRLFEFMQNEAQHDMQSHGVLTFCTRKENLSALWSWPVADRVRSKLPSTQNEMKMDENLSIMRDSRR
jgi:hypothetical protein